MDKHPHVILVKEDPFLSRFQVADFFDTMKNVAASTATLDLAGAAKDSLNIVKYELSVGHLAHKLIFTALSKAILGLLTEEHRRIIGSTVDSKRKIETDVQELGETLELKISLDFFRQAPHKFELIRKVRPIYAQWLVSLGLSDSEAQKLQKKLPAEYLKELANEFHEDEAYQRILDELNSPFNEIFTKEYHKAKYYAELESLINQPAMGDENLPLSKVYIKPYFAIHEKCCEDKYQRNKWKRYNDGFVIDDQAYGQSIHRYVEDRIIYKRQPLGLGVEQKNIIFLLGQPGQGKSSFCYYTLHQLLEHPDFNQQLYFIQLKYLDTNELITHPFNPIKQYLKESWQLDFVQDNALLILDGLDELYMSNGLKDKDLEGFYHKLEQQVDKARGLTIILTSRYNYLNLSAIDKNETTILRLAPLRLEQQQKWLEIYRSVYDKGLLDEKKLVQINKENKFKHLKELIEQPILLHLVANADVDIDDKDNRATIYKNLFDAIIKRKWSDKQLKTFQNLDSNKHAPLFRYWLQEIAFEIYTSNFEYIQRAQLEKLSYTEVIQGVIDIPDIKDALKNLLVSFYFKNVPHQQEDKTEIEVNKGPIEFLHKSLQEYLAAEYIWTTIKKELLAPNDDDFKFNINTPKDALGFFSRLFAKKRLNHSTRMILIEMIQNDSNQTLKEQIRERLKRFLSECLHYQFLSEYDVKSNALVDTPPLDQAFNTFRGYWLVLSHLAPKKNKDLLNENTVVGFCGLIIRGGGNYINLSNLNLSDANLRQAGLSHASLNDANLSEAHLWQVDLSHANLSHVDLYNADLVQAYLWQANLRLANLRLANLSHADLGDANLRQANLRQVNLRGAYLGHADLRGADLRDANLRGADLSNTDLRDANLRGADLSNTDLRDANLKNAKVSLVNFIQQLKDWKCIRIEEIEPKYYIDSTPQYDDLNEDKEDPYYLIKEKELQRI